MENKRPAAAFPDFVIPKDTTKKPKLIEIKKKNILVLFSGTKSITRSVAKYFPKEFNVVSVDLDPQHQPTHCVDILKWDYKQAYPQDFFEYVWASPPCEQYSILKTRQDRNLALANSLVKRTLKIIKYFNPRIFWIENPATGLLCHDIKPYKKQTLLDHIRHVDVDYCQYSTDDEQFPYRKPTRIWSNGLRHFVAHRCIKQNCKMIADRKTGRHFVCLGNFHQQEWNGQKVDLNMRHRVPMLLIKKLILASERI